MIHSHPLFAIYFGNAHDSLNQDEYYSFSHDFDLMGKQPYAQLSKTLGVTSLVFLKQIHNNTGYVVTEETVSSFKQPFSFKGDYLLTNVSRVGIGIMTADCLPIIIHDTRANALAAIHAGWRGSVAHIAQCAFDRMQETYGTRVDDVRIFFGPSAQPCCYQVGDAVTQYCDKDPWVSQSLIEREDGVYLNVARYNMLQLKELGISKTAFHLNYNTCTICDEQYCSYRRDTQSPYRQMTVAALR